MGTRGRVVRLQQARVGQPRASMRAMNDGTPRLGRPSEGIVM